ncbi:paeninodin family lasso peptide [Fredinandcohnia sp. 179-A 10B2 NHS]|uniref:paeninodin family lasso peptide n=1 Tax=Fredinandcohnia sp. 179-A 10B2 NHS TaxID=3235176 RepID=UPI0039A0A418
MKKAWSKPSIEVLEIGLTMGGDGNAVSDSYCTSEHPNINPDGKINKACVHPDLLGS